MAWIAAATIGSAALGAYGANQSRKSQDKATAASQQGFNQYKPYVDANLAGSQSALDNVIGQGAYTGQTYAGPNDFQTGTANTMGGYGMDMQGSGFGMMGDNSGFGANSNSMYNQFQGMSEDAKNDRLGTAMDYASANSGSLVDSAMRDDRRNLQENTLTGIDLAASGSGNMNSSRAGVAEAVANRGYDDRRADVTSDINQQLMDQSLDQQNQQFKDQVMANNGVSNAYSQGINSMGTMGEAVANRGYDDRRADVTMGIQDRLVDRSLNQQSQQFADRGTALNAARDANSGIGNAYEVGMNTLGEGANFGMNAGNSLQGYSQAGMDDQRRRFEEQRDFELAQRKGYQSGVLGKSPNSPSVNATTASPVAGALTGAMTGFGFMKEYGDRFQTPQPQVAAQPTISDRPRMRPGGFA